MKLNLKGKTFGLDNTLVYPAAAVAVLGGAALFITSSNISFGVPKTTEPPAVRVNYNIYPPVIKPFRKIRIQGQFESANGVPAAVPFGYYAIFENVPAGSYSREGRLLVSSGIVGQNVSVFRQDLPTDNFRTGPYTIYVSNAPIREDPLKGKQVELQLAGGRPVTIG